MSRHEPMRPEGNAAFVQSVFQLLRWRFEDSGARDRHLELSLHASQARQYALTNLANQLHGETARFAFGRNSVLGKSCRAEFAGQRWRAGPIADDLDLSVLNVDRQ